MERSITATIYKSSTHEKSKIQQNPDSQPFPLNSDKRTQINTNHSFILCSSTKIFKSQYHWLDKHCTQIQGYTQYNVHKYTLKKSNFRSKFVQKSLKEIFYTFSSATKCLNTLWSFHMHKLSNRHTHARAHSLTVHPEDPVDGLQQEVHVVMDSDASEHIDLLCEALKTQRN